MKKGEKKIEYYKKGKKIGPKDLKGTFPKEMIPTKITEKIFEVLFVLSLLISLALFPWGQLMGGDLNTELSIGYPYPMFSISFAGEVDDVINIKGIILDILIILLLSYSLEVVFNIIKLNIKKTDVKNINTKKTLEVS